MSISTPLARPWVKQVAAPADDITGTQPTMNFTPYLNFDGNCAEAFRFYEQSLDGTIESMMTHGESPIAGEVPDDWQDTIMHARLRIGDAVLMASDTPPGTYTRPSGIWVSIQLDDVDAAERIFAAFSEGGTVLMPLAPTFWAERFAMVTDRYGTPWMINCGMRQDPG